MVQCRTGGTIYCAAYHGVAGTGPNHVDVWPTADESGLSARSAVLPGVGWARVLPGRLITNE